MVATRPRQIPEVLWWRTYSNLLYILLGFPLSLVYFISLILGFCLGVSLAVLVVGIPILLVTVLMVWNFAAFERTLAHIMIGVEIPAPREEITNSLLTRAKNLLTRGFFWKILTYFFFKLFLNSLAFAAMLIIWLPGLVFLLAPWLFRGQNFIVGSFQIVLNSSQEFGLALVGFGLSIIAARITNLTAPILAQIASFALTDNQLEVTTQKARLEALALASSAANLASSLSVAGQFEATLLHVLRQAQEALGASAGALMLESRSLSHGFSPHALSALLEIRALDGDGVGWRKTIFENGYVVRPKKRNDAVWQSLAIMPLTQNSQPTAAKLVMRFEDSTPQKADLEFLATIGNQISVALENSRLIAKAQSQAALEERHRLARELHDSVSQALFGIALGARTAKALLSRDPEKAREPLEYVLQLAEAGVTEMRALIFELRPEILEKEGLMAALAKQAEMMRLRYQLEVETVFEAEPALPLEVKQTLLRIAQEALHNTVKHAKASRAKLEWQALCLTIADDGIGFDPQNTSSGLGQRTMRERAESLGAKYTVISDLGQGTKIQVQLPNR